MAGWNDGGRYDWECPPGPEDEPPTCVKCSAPLPTGPSEPASGLCATCDEVEADRERAIEHAAAKVDARHEAAEQKRDRKREVA